jgi:hypothetical protein
VVISRHRNFSIAAVVAMSATTAVIGTAQELMTAQFGRRSRP